LLNEYFSGIWKYRYILMSLVNRDLQMKYRNSKLGVAWSILTPLGLVIIIGSVYSILFGADPKTFIPMLFAGLNPWIFLSGAADGGTMSFVVVEGSLKQTNVSVQIFPLRTVLSGFINLLYSLLAFFTIYLFLQPDRFDPMMLMVFPGLLLMFLFSLGWANFTSVITLYLRDFQPMQSLILQAVFYATPIIYPKENLAQKGFEILYRVNPFYYIIEVVRGPMLGVELPSTGTYLIAAAFAVLVFLLGTYVLMKKRKEIVFLL